VLRALVLGLRPVAISKASPWFLTVAKREPKYTICVSYFLNVRVEMKLDSVLLKRLS